MANAKNPPAQRFRIGNVTAAVWRNDSGFNVTVQRSYKDGDEWKQSASLFHDDLLNAARVLQRAEAWIAEQQ